MSLAALRNLLADLVTQAGGPRTPALAALTHAELARHPASSIAVALDGRTDDAGQFAVRLALAELALTGEVTARCGHLVDACDGA